MFDASSKIGWSIWLNLHLCKEQTLILFTVKGVWSQKYWLIHNDEIYFFICFNPLKHMIKPDSLCYAALYILQWFRVTEGEKQHTLTSLRKSSLMPRQHYLHRNTHHRILTWGSIWTECMHAWLIKGKHCFHKCTLIHQLLDNSKIIFTSHCLQQCELRPDFVKLSQIAACCTTFPIFYENHIFPDIPIFVCVAVFLQLEF